MSHPYDIGTRVRFLHLNQWTSGIVRKWHFEDREFGPGFEVPVYIYTVEDSDGKLWGEVEENWVIPEKPEKPPLPWHTPKPGGRWD